MSSPITAPRPLHGWAQPTVATDWTADMLERLPDDGWRYELLEGRVLRRPPPGTDHGNLEARLSRGVRLVWVVWPERRAIDIWTAGAAAPRTLGDTDSLDDGDVVLGFHLPLTEIW